MYAFVKKIFGPRVVRFLRRIVYSPLRVARPYYDYDMRRLMKYSGVFKCDRREQFRAKVIMLYHIVEKGLTMPARRLGFGKNAICDLMAQISLFKNRFLDDDQVAHAVGVLKAYLELHQGNNALMETDTEFWDRLKEFLGKYPNVPIATQTHMSKEEFYRDKESPFSKFAFARHTLRHYSSAHLDIELVRKAVGLAISTPSACNRQHCRVYCVSDKSVMAKLLKVQGGNRGFGHLADKVLIVTANLENILFIGERNDAFTNGGMFLMNLCYALYYYEIAHCILNWSLSPKEDSLARSLVKIPDSETIIAILTCGVAPDEFDVCSSPRKQIDEYFVEL